MKLKQIVEEQMSGIRKNIWKHLKDRVFREAYVEEHVRAGVAYQIKAMREARGWSQAQFAEKCGKSQSNIARIEDPDYGKFSIQTLLEVAHTFDVWLSLEFVSFGKGLSRTANRSAAVLNVFSFEHEREQSLNFNRSSGTKLNANRSLSSFENVSTSLQTLSRLNINEDSAAAQTGKLSGMLNQVRNEKNQNGTSWDRAH
jgi:transcriptional regulator with XRE-family HTH domain